MKKIIWGIIGIPVAIVMCYLISYITKFTFFLINIDNTEFGFPIWLDILIDIIAGVITYGFVLSLFSLSKKDMETAEQVISILVGFTISVATHCLLKFWYIISGILFIFIVVVIVLFIKEKKQKRRKL